MHLRFSFPAETSEALKKRIKRADKLSAYFEAVQLAGFTMGEAKRLFAQPSFDGWTTIKITPLPPAEAEAAFLKRFRALMALR